ncbi:MAG: helix-turn-helix domain-containing protein [Pseudonocardia sp.]
MASTDDAERGTLLGLAARLRALRKAAGLSQVEAAGLIHVSQGKISRAETGRFLLEPALVRQLAEFFHADATETAEIVSWAEALRPQRLDSRLIMQRGTNHFQERIRRMEEASTTVRSYQPGVVLGSLQTAAYATAIFARRPAAEATASVMARLERHRMMLEDSARLWTLLQTEGALLWHVGGPGVMVEQLDRLIEASRLPNVRLGLLTHAKPMPFTAAHGFHLYDQQAVQIGTRTATALTTDARDIAEYDALFRRLEQAAAFGDAAREELRAITDRYRSMI